MADAEPMPQLDNALKRFGGWRAAVDRLCLEAYCRGIDCGVHIRAIDERSLKGLVQRIVATNAGADRVARSPAAPGYVRLTDEVVQ